MRERNGDSRLTPLAEVLQSYLKRAGLVRRMGQAGVIEGPLLDHPGLTHAPYQPRTLQVGLQHLRERRQPGVTIPFSHFSLRPPVRRETLRSWRGNLSRLHPPDRES